ncbi:MAG: tyrosine-type recombinase/integrase [Actinomycetota bacterium]|nr:tyrosine-type recombinase/integrase [Actinomycetota bacterium]
MKVDGKYRRTYHPTKTAANRALDEMRTEVNKGAVIVDGNTTLADLLDRWEAKVLPAKNLSVRTLDTYRWACSILRADLGTTRLRGLTADVVEETFERRADAGMSRASLVKVRSVLGMSLEWAERRGSIGRNIARIVDLPAGARRATEGRSLTAEQARAILAATEHRLHALWTVMLYLGLRPGEATGLTWADVDLEQGIVHVRRSLKLERGRLVVDERLKTDRSRRSLEMPAQLVATLRAHRTEQTKARLRAGELWVPAYDLVFTTALGTPLGPRNVHRSLTQLTQRLGLGPVHPHELRHSQASLLSAAGVPMERIADQLGHDGTRMGLLVYRHAVKPTVDAGMVMGEVLS